MLSTFAQDMLRHVEDNPTSLFGKFIFNKDHNAADLLDFMMWIERQPIVILVDSKIDLDLMIKKYQDAAKD
jgi:hypothetical protein